MKIEYKRDVVDGSIISVTIGNDEFEAACKDGEPSLYETFIPKLSFTDFPIKELRNDLEIKVCDHFELSDKYDDTPVINGTGYTFRKVADDRLVILFEDTGRRKFWDGEIGFKIYMDAKKQAVESRAKEIGDTTLDFSEDDADYIVMNFSCEIRIENLSHAVVFADQTYHKLKRLQTLYLTRNLKKSWTQKTMKKQQQSKKRIWK